MRLAPASAFSLRPSLLSAFPSSSSRPSAIPYVTDAAEAQRAPELAVLSVLAHAHEADAEPIAAPALKAVATLASDFALLYSEVIQEALSPAAKAALEKLMDIRNYEFKSEFAKFAKRHRAEGTRHALLAILDARGLSVSGAEQETIAACTDDATLTRWIRKAATVATVAEVFAEG
ncbi:MAG: hypothetical protein IPG50_06165 [Myxococcales bacterium]|nr:hypothetical protein [Myxococcales bacterium]